MMVQPTHRVDFNGPDALYHSVVKRRLRRYPFPLCQEHILPDYSKAVEKVSMLRVIQRSFWGAHRRDDIRVWYMDSADEEETVSEKYSDLEDES